jgi:ATP-dependent protease ClpP protease subunit
MPTTIRLNGEIGWQVSAIDVIRQLEEAALVDKQITIAFEWCPGGEVFQALAIYNAIRKLKDSGVEIVAQVEVLAASAYSFIALACSKVLVNSTAFIMIHRAWGLVRSESDAKNLEDINNLMVQLYAKKTGKSEDEIKQMINNESWMTAEEALAEGFADQVIDVLSTPEVEEVTSLLKNHISSSINKTTEINAVNALSALTDLYTKTKNNNSKMLDKINATLGLDVKASIEDSINAIGQLVSKANLIAAKEQAIADLTTKVTALETEVQANRTERAQQLVNEAIASGQINGKASENWLKLATNDYEGTKALIADLPKSKVKLSQVVNASVADANAKASEIKLSPFQTALQEAKGANQK